MSRNAVSLVSDTASDTTTKTHLVRRQPTVKSLKATLAANRRLLRTMAQEKFLMEQIIATTSPTKVQTRRDRTKPPTHGEVRTSSVR